MTKVRTAILISGGGSNMEALIAASRRPGVAAIAFDHKAYDREGLERAVDAELEKAGVELVCLAGWMRLLSPYLIGKWHNRMINIHPSLLPDFKGLHTHRRALEAGKTEHGCTVHFVRQDVDSGPIIGQAKVPVLPGDTEDVLAARVLAEEHKLYPYALELVASGRVRVEGDEIVRG